MVHKPPPTMDLARAIIKAPTLVCRGNLAHFFKLQKMPTHSSDRTRTRNKKLWVSGSRGRLLTKIFIVLQMFPVAVRRSLNGITAYARVNNERYFIHICPLHY
jgi:hypothetical protein